MALELAEQLSQKFSLSAWASSGKQQVDVRKNNKKQIQSNFLFPTLCPYLHLQGKYQHCRSQILGFKGTRISDSH